MVEFNDGLAFCDRILGKIGIGRNPDYYSYSTNCANFVSQCLYAGGMKQNDSWHSNYPENKDDIAPAWRLAQEQYNYFSNEDNGYINGDVIEITSADEIVEAIDTYNI